MQDESSVGTYTRCTHIFARLAPILYAQSVLIDKISVSELCRELLKSALLVGRERKRGWFPPAILHAWKEREGKGSFWFGLACLPS